MPPKPLKAKVSSVQPPKFISRESSTPQHQTRNINSPNANNRSTTGPRRAAASPTPATPRHHSVGDEVVPVPFGAALFPGPPNLVLSPEEELEILERLQAGTWNTGIGWSQFLDPVNARREMEAAHYAQKGKGGVKQNLSKASAAAGDAETDDDDDNPELPLWMKKTDQIISAVDSYKDLIERTIAVAVNAQFAEYCPPDAYERFMKQMDQVMQLVKVCTDTKFAETIELIFEDTSPRSLPCSAEERDDFLTAMDQLSHNLKKFDLFLVKDKEVINQEKMIEKFEQLTNELDDVFVTEQNIKLIEKYTNTINLLANELNVGYGK